MEITMSERVNSFGLQVDKSLYQFINQDVLKQLDITEDDFWKGFAEAVTTLTPKNRDLLATRKSLQDQIDAWFLDRRGKDIDQTEYVNFLKDIGYLVPEGEDFQITTDHVDEEMALVAGPQLVVPGIKCPLCAECGKRPLG
jgi:malate synthase